MDKHSAITWTSLLAAAGLTVGCSQNDNERTLALQKQIDSLKSTLQKTNDSIAKLQQATDSLRTQLPPDTASQAPTK